VQLRKKKSELFHLQTFKEKPSGCFLCAYYVKMSKSHNLQMLMQWRFLWIHSFQQPLLKCFTADKFSKQKINLSFNGYLYLFFSQLRVPALRNAVCKTRKVTYFKFRQLTCVKFQYHSESFHCTEHLKYEFTFSLELNAKAIQVCCNVQEKKKKTLIRGLTFNSCNFTGSIPRGSLLPSLSEQRHVGPFFVDSTTSHPYGR